MLDFCFFCQLFCFLPYWQAIHAGIDPPHVKPDSRLPAGHLIRMPSAGERPEWVGGRQHRVGLYPAGYDTAVCLTKRISWADSGAELLGLLMRHLKSRNAVKAEMPSLKGLAAEQSEMGFQIVPISVDGPRKSEFGRRTGGVIPFPVLLDGGGRTFRRYDIHHVPTVVVISPDSVVRFTAHGYPSNQVILRELRRIASGQHSERN